MKIGINIFFRWLYNGESFTSLDVNSF